MIRTIKTVKDVRRFFKELSDLNLNFNPDEEFEPGFGIDPARCRRYNELMDQSRKACQRSGVSVHGICADVLRLSRITKSLRAIAIEIEEMSE